MKKKNDENKTKSVKKPKKNNKNPAKTYGRNNAPPKIEEEVVEALAPYMKASMLLLIRNLTEIFSPSMPMPLKMRMFDSVNDRIIKIFVALCDCTYTCGKYDLLPNLDVFRDRLERFVNNVNS